MTDPYNPPSGQQPAQPQYNPPSGQQPAQPQYGGYSPPRGQQPAQPQYAPPNADQQTQQYAQPQYQQQFGQPQQPPYGGYQQGYGQPTAPKRPGLATAAAVLALVFGVGFGIYGAAALVFVAAAGDYSSDSSGIGSGSLAVGWISTLLITAGAIVLFIGGIQTLSGSTVLLLRIGAAAIAVGLLVAFIYGLAEGASSSTTVVVLILLLVPSGLVLGLSFSGEIAKWQAKKQAWRAAGYED